MTYEIFLGAGAEKDLERIGKRLEASAKEVLSVLKTNPHAGDLLQGVMAGYRSLHFSLKGGQYRAVYEV